MSHGVVAPMLSLLAMLYWTTGAMAPDVSALPGPNTPTGRGPALFAGPTGQFGASTLTLGGFVEAVAVYREHFVSEDIATSFWSVPYPHKSAYFAPELRLSGRQSRLFLHATQNPDDPLAAQAHFEIDFLGAAATANSIQSNSFTPRLRHAYAQVSWQVAKWRLALLAGQTWSLLTLGGQQLAAGSEAPPPVLDAQFMPGFLWARQPQLRLTATHAPSGMAVSLSAENPQTTFLSAAPAGAVTTVAGGFLFSNTASMSLSHVPDVLVKVAHDQSTPRLRTHGELFAMGRVFSVRSTLLRNERVLGGAVGGSVRAQLPSLWDLQMVLSGAIGKGLGRYGSTQFADVTLDTQAIPKGKQLLVALAGLDVAPHPRVRVYGFAGVEQVPPHNDLPEANNGGCLTAGGQCSGANGRIWEATMGAWGTISQGGAFRMRLGLQYAYISRTLIQVLGQGPTTHQQQGYLALRCDL